MLPRMDINGVSAIVTGGASGIGAAAARQLAERGAIVVVADLQEEKGAALAEEIGGAFVKVDVTKTDDIVNAVEMAKSIGPVRVLVNSAGIGWAQRTVGKDGTYDSAANLDAFKRVIAINLVGSFDCIRIVGTAMSTTEPMEFGERGAIVIQLVLVRLLHRVQANAGAGKDTGIGDAAGKPGRTGERRSGGSGAR